MTASPLFREDDGELWLSCPEGDNSSQQFRVRDVLQEKTTPYQHLMMLDTYDFGHALVLDGIVQTTSMDGFIYNEMISHAALGQMPGATRVLIIGGGDLGVAREVLKYPAIEQVDMVEIDAAVVESSIEYLPDIADNAHRDSRLNIVYTDGVQFVAECDTRYDVIIVDSSDPIGPAVELFSQPFYSNLKRCLSPDGIISCQSLSPHYSMIMLRHIRDVLGLFFPHVDTCLAVVPTYAGGLYSFTLASPRPFPAYRADSIPKDLRYASGELLSESFTFPAFLRAQLHGMDD